MAKHDAIISFEEAVAYRTPAPVTMVRRFRYFSPASSFPVCPRCKITMEREYQSFCDRCGQALDWKNFSKAIIVISP